MFKTFKIVFLFRISSLGFSVLVLLESQLIPSAGFKNTLFEAF